MENHEEKIVELYWEGPFSIKQLKKKLKRDVRLTSAWSLYSLYGWHPLYGNCKLVYIGMTEREVTKRISEHSMTIEQVRVASIFKFLDWKTANDWDYNQAGGLITEETVVRDVESLLIYALSPAYNTKNKKSAAYSGSLRLFNTGAVGSIPAEISGKYWVENPKVRSSEIADDR